MVQRGYLLDVEIIFQFLLSQLQQSTRASELNCCQVAQRLTDEVTRICHESRRIQTSGNLEHWAKTLATHRLKQCLAYYHLGSKQGRIDLQSTLSSIVYRYIFPSRSQGSYQSRIILIEDFLQGFYAEALNAFRREFQLSATYTPRTLLELAEYMSFCERYGKRRISLPGNRSQQLIILRAQTFSQQQPSEMPVDLEMATQGVSLDENTERSDPAVAKLKDILAESPPMALETGLREKIIEELIHYFEERQQSDCIDYFILRLQDLPASDIDDILGLTPRQRDYLQQRFKYHLTRFTLSHRWELVHQWLEVDLEKNLGLTPQEWQLFVNQLTPQQQKLLQLKQQDVPLEEIPAILSRTPNQIDKQWFKLLSLAWEIRNRSLSRSGASDHE